MPHHHHYDGGDDDDDQLCCRAMKAKLKRLTARVKYLSARMQCIEEGDAKIKKFISQAKTKIIRMESVSSAAEKSLGVLVSNLGKTETKE